MSYNEKTITQYSIQQHMVKKDPNIKNDCIQFHHIIVLLCPPLYIQHTVTCQNNGSMFPTVTTVEIGYDTKTSLEVNYNVLKDLGGC